MKRTFSHLLKIVSGDVQLLYKSVSNLLYQEGENERGGMEEEAICNNLSSLNTGDNNKDRERDGNGRDGTTSGCFHWERGNF